MSKQFLAGLELRARAGPEINISTRLWLEKERRKYYSKLTPEQDRTLDP